MWGGSSRVIDMVGQARGLIHHNNSQGAQLFVGWVIATDPNIAPQLASQTHRSPKSRILPWVSGALRLYQTLWRSPRLNLAGNALYPW